MILVLLFTSNRVNKEIILRKSNGTFRRSLLEGKKMQYWYAIYTNRDAEFKLHDNIQNYSNSNSLNYEIYLPIVKEKRQWSDRKVKVNRPMFKNYLFVKHGAEGFHQLKSLPGFKDYVRLGRYPSQITQEEIDMVKVVEKNFDKVECVSSRLMRGDKVKVFNGALKGHQGILIKEPHGYKVALELTSLSQCINVEVPIEHITLLS